MATLPPDATSSAAPPAPDTAVIDAPLHLFGFEFEEISPDLVSGRLLVTEKCCQPFKVLHGGVSAMIGEALGSIGACVNCGMKRVAGVNLSIHHVRSAVVGDLLVAEARPISAGSTIQVWEVQIWKTDPSNSSSKTLVSSSRLTILCGMSVPDRAKGYFDAIRKNAKL